MVASGTAAAMADAVIGPMPGMVASRRLASSARCQARICVSSLSTSMCRGARLHADEAWWQRREELQHLGAPELPAHQHLAISAVA